MVEHLDTQREETMTWERPAPTIDTRFSVVSAFERRDVVIVASVSCIYGIGAPEEYGKTVVSFRKGGSIRRERILRHLVDIQYERNDSTLVRGAFRVRGDTLEVFPAYEEIALRI